MVNETWNGKRKAKIAAKKSAAKAKHTAMCAAALYLNIPRDAGHKNINKTMYERHGKTVQEYIGEHPELLVAWQQHRAGKNKNKHTERMAKDVSGDAFLSTYEWRRVRMVALKKYGARCQCCGATPADGVKMNVDHIKPRKLFPQLALDVENLQILCEVCNHGKGNWDMTDWREDAETELDKIAMQHIRNI